MTSTNTPAPVETPIYRSVPARPPSRRWALWLVAALLLVSGIVTTGYAGMSVYVATRLVNYNEPRKPILRTPADYGLSYHPVTFLSSTDHVQLRGWFIPGVLPDGQLTAQRTIIMVHGNRQNRTDPDVGQLALSADLAHQGFAVLAFDLRGNGESPPAPMSLGYFEPRDVLGAVDFLRSGPLPYPQLGRPNVIGGWGMSLGAASLLIAAAQEPAIAAVISDDAFAYAVPRIEHDVAKEDSLEARLAQPFTPGALFAARFVYGVDWFAVRPVDVVAKIAPRPLLFIHPDADPDTPIWNFNALVAAARGAPNAHVESWVVPGVTQHAQSFHTHPAEYMSRVTSFFTATLGTYAPA